MGTKTQSPVSYRSDERESVRVTSPSVIPVLDCTEGLRRSGGDEQLFRELTAVFLADVSRLTQLIHVALAERSAEGLRQAAHSLRGSASQIGALAVTERASILEKMGKAADLGDAPEQRLLLTEELRQLLLALNAADLLSS